MENGSYCLAITDENKKELDSKCNDVTYVSEVNDTVIDVFNLNSPLLFDSNNTSQSDIRIEDRNITKKDVKVKCVNEDIRTELWKATIIQLEEQIASLKDDIRFMKNEITHKNSLISLFAPLDPLNRLTSQHNTDQNNSSLLLEEIMDEKKKTRR